MNELFPTSIEEGVGRFALLLLLLLAVPLLLLAWGKRIYPHRPLLILAAAPCLLSLLLLANPETAVLVLILDGTIAAVALADLLTLPRQEAFAVQREVGRIASLRAKQRVKIQVSNRSANPLMVSIRDDLPPEFDAEPEQFTVVLEPSSRTTVSYRFRASRRGAFELPQVHLRVRSRLGLWNRLLSYDELSTVYIYPDMKQLEEYAILARTNRLSLIGVRRTRRVGQDNEFERLRDYTRDDNYRHLDWRATARRNKLTVRDFQTNQSQRLVFLLDCGRMMTSDAGGLTLLDHALNAVLMLSYVALRQGDSVGLITFSDRVHSYLPPRGGLAQMNHLLHASFDRFPELVESRYDQAFLQLDARCKKRSLVVLMTNLIDDVNARQIQEYLGIQVGRHLPLGVLLRDRHLFAAVEDPPATGPGLYEAAAAADILSWRHEVLTELQHRGVRVLDVFPEELTADIVNQYLEIKARHLL